jgi:hypothetical protein
MIDGRTVMEIPGEPRAAAEIGQLWAYLQQRLAGERRTLLASHGMAVKPPEAALAFGVATP